MRGAGAGGVVLPRAGPPWPRLVQGMLGPLAGGPAWAARPPATLPETMRRLAHHRRAAHEAPCADGDWGARFAACPLCGQGEAGAVGHLANWCPAVGKAWMGWAGAEAPHLQDPKDFQATCANLLIDTHHHLI